MRSFHVIHKLYTFTTCDNIYTIYIRKTATKLQTHNYAEMKGNHDNIIGEL